MACNLDLRHGPKSNFAIGSPTSGMKASKEHKNQTELCQICHGVSNNPPYLIAKFSDRSQLRVERWT